MRIAALPCLAVVAALAGCAPTGEALPSLQPRTAERIDPRVPIERPLNDRPANAAVTGRLAALVAQARSGEPAFAAALGAAQRAAAGAGAPQSESWIAAQEALSAAIEARAPAANALGGIDTLGATLLASNGGIAPADKAAMDEAAAVVFAIDRRQADALDAVKARLGG